jgi:cell division protein FtsZ
MTTPLDNSDAAPAEETAAVPFKEKIRIKVCGVGGAGCNAASFIAQDKLEHIEFLLLNTDAQALAASPLPDKLVLGQKRARGLGTGGDPEMGRAAAEDDAPRLRAFCEGADIIFILTGLGGGTGTGAAPVLARLARESGALVLALATLPFDFEGGRRQRQAVAGLHHLKAAADAVICLPNQKLFKLLDENTSFLETFKISNSLMAEGLRGIWRLLTQTGLINIDFADLCSVTRGRHVASSFATAEAGGERRGEQVIEKLLSHPLLDGGQVLNESDAVLVSLVGGPDLTMSEVNKVMEPLQRQCENAHLIFGAAIDDTFTGQLSVTLIASRHSATQTAPPPTAAAAAPVAEPNPTVDMQFLDPAPPPRPASRFVAPAPEMSNEKKEQMYTRQTGHSRRKRSRMQKELPLEIVFKGRFDKSEPTIRHGEDLDLPTYIRRGVALN